VTQARFAREAAAEVELILIEVDDGSRMEDTE
jgi:hypothetical protein